MSRRTRIVATLGPATDPPAVLRRLLAAGVDVARINFSHGTADEHLGRIARLEVVLKVSAHLYFFRRSPDGEESLLNRRILS